MSQTGACLCGQIRYSFDTTPIATVHCHCRDCQKATGSGFATVFGLAEDAVTINTTGEICSYTVTADSGQTVTRQFCGNCGSQLFTLAQNNPGFLWIKAGSLDDSSWLVPTDSCWAGSAQSWAPADPTLNQHSGNPE